MQASYALQSKWLRQTQVPPQSALRWNNYAEPAAPPPAPIPAAPEPKPSPRPRPKGAKRPTPKKAPPSPKVIESSEEDEEEEEEEEDEEEAGAEEEEEGEREEEEDDEEFCCTQWDGTFANTGRPVRNLWQAAWDGDVEVIKTFIKAGADLNRPGYDGYGCGLYYRESDGEYVAVPAEETIYHGGVAEATPLHFAAAAGHVEMVEFLVQPALSVQCDVRLSTTNASPKDVARANRLRAVCDLLDDITHTYDLESPVYGEIQDKLVASKLQSKSAPRGTQPLAHLAQLQEPSIRVEWQKWDAKAAGAISMATLRKAYTSWEKYGVEESTEEVEQLLRRFTGLMDNGLVCFEEFATLRCHYNGR